MPSNQIQNAQTASQYFEQANERLKDEFVIYGEAGSSIKLLSPEKVTGLKGSVEDLATATAAEVVTYSKESILETRLPSTNKTAELNVINRNQIYDTMVWTTTAENIKKALRSGVFVPAPIQNPLAKMIAQLGTFKLLVFSRSTEENFKVKHNEEKLAVVDFTQDCIEAIQPLHFMINNYDGSVSPQQNLDELIHKLDRYSKQLEAIKNANQLTGEFYKSLYAGVDPLIASISRYKFNLEARLRKRPEVTLAEVQGILGPYANPLSNPDLSLQHFMQAQLNVVLINAVEANYTTTGLFQDWSDLHKIITETQYISESFSSDDVDYHNPISPQHAFDFADVANTNNLVTLDMRRFGFVPSTRLELAKQVALIQKIDSNTKLYKDADEERGFFGINWRGNVRAPLTWLMNGAKDIIGTGADIVYLIGKIISDEISRVQGKKPEPVNFPSGTPIFLKTDLAEQRYASLDATTKLYKTIPPVTKIPHESLIQKLYSGARSIVTRYLIEPVVSVSRVIADELWHLKTARKIWYDATIGLKKVNETTISLLLHQRINQKRANEAGNDISQQALIESYIDISDNPVLTPYREIKKDLNELKLTAPPAAVIPYHLTPDIPGDFVNFITNDLGRSFAQFFSHEVYRGHPVAGLAFTVAASTALPMIFPVLMNNPLLAEIHKDISLPLAQTLIGETTGTVSGISTALLQGKITYLALDIFNGRNSLLNYGVKSLLENPVTATVVTAAAIGFGYTIAYELEIPYISEKIAEETLKASFPYFELGLTGAKFAAILVEGTLNLHHEQHVISSDEFVDNAIDKMRTEINLAMCAGYRRTNKIDANTQLSKDDMNKIELQASLYCNKIKEALKNPDIAQQISQLTYTLGTMVGVKNPPAFNGVPARVTNQASEKELALFLQRRDIRHQITELDPKNLTERNKYIILNYLAQTYPTDAAYVASVRTRFEQEKKVGPIGETLKIVVSYPGAIIRSAIASVRSLTYRMGAFYYKRVGDPGRARAMLETSRHAVIPLNDFVRKIKNDFGLVVKGITSMFRNFWGLIAGSLLLPLTIFLAGPLAMLSSQRAIKMFGRINTLLYAPGIISKLIDYSVGIMRRDVGSKDLLLVTQDIDVRLNRKVLNPALSTPQKATVSTTLISVEDKDDLVKNRLINMFARYPSLSSILANSPSTLQILIENIKRESAKGDKHKFYFFNTPKDQFNQDLRKTLLQVHALTAEWDEFTFKDQLKYQLMIMDLFYGNKNDPISEFIISYEGFKSVNLPPAPKDGVLAKMHSTLAAAQIAVLDLSATYNPDEDRATEVVRLIRKNDCLSLHIVRQIARLQTIIQQMSEQQSARRKAGEPEPNDDLAIARKMLHALGFAHQSARIAAHRLAGNAEVYAALTELHKPLEDRLSDAMHSTTFGRSKSVAPLKEELLHQSAQRSRKSSR